MMVMMTKTINVECHQQRPRFCRPQQAQQMRSLCILTKIFGVHVTPIIVKFGTAGTLVHEDPYFGFLIKPPKISNFANLFSRCDESLARYS